MLACFIRVFLWSDPAWRGRQCVVHARLLNSVEFVVWVGRMHHFPRDYGVTTRRRVNVEYSFTECGIKGESLKIIHKLFVCLFNGDQVLFIRRRERT